MKERTLIQELRRTYRGGVERDKFGRRPALPTEINRVIQARFPEDLEGYLPCESDISVKVDARKKKKRTRNKR